MTPALFLIFLLLIPSFCEDSEFQCHPALKDLLQTHSEQMYYDKLFPTLQQIGRTDIAIELGKNINQDKTIAMQRYVEEYHDQVNKMTSHLMHPQTEKGSHKTTHHFSKQGVSPRKRTTSQCKSEPPLLRTSKRTIYTAGRPPWYNEHGTQSKEAFVIGLCGGSASGKTTVARKIIEALDVPWVVLLSMDSFYKVLSDDEQLLAASNDYNFDHPDAFDFDLLVSTLRKLKQGKSIKIPVYDFSTHGREKEWKTVYGASVIIFEGILSFADKELLKLLDMKIFVDADSDIRLIRRLKRDISERGRDINGVLKQYNKFVKPAFEQYIEPSMRLADIVVPRGGGNMVAIDLIVQHVHSQLEEVHIVNTPQGRDYVGRTFQGKRITGVSILRAGETMEPALRAVCKDVRIGKILIQTNQDTGEPELHYLRLPKDISEDHVILMDCTVSTGAAAMMAVRVLLDHDVHEDKIQLVSLLMAAMGVHSVAYAFPQVKIITTAVDKKVNELFHIIPGIGNFGDRYFGTDAPPDWSDEDIDEPSC
ncbi:Uridine-cytidine kinase-like 1 [Bagarius yarrelli]|uniref:Uridine-cytidine kinase n=1 Tax=Bagarius yarrelli TaxID=175774 RepID=A0A556V2I1_BAGYA|nr:Uridine-cytidine kinase-like 1 [Bagarius yarrelli]